MENNHAQIPSPTSQSYDRKTVERNRRNHMKTLCSQLYSLIPHHRITSSKDGAQLSDQLAEAANYIKVLKQRIDKMSEKKQELVTHMSHIEACESREKFASLQPPQIDIQDLGSALMVVAVGGLDSQHLFYQLVEAIKEGGANIINAGFAAADDKIFHTIHAQVPQDSGSHYDSSKLSASLKKLVDIQQELAAPKLSLMRPIYKCLFQNIEFDLFVCVH